MLSLTHCRPHVRCVCVCVSVGGGICTVVRYFCSFTIISAGQSKELDGSKMSCNSVGAHVEKEKAYSTWYSQAVSHPSTNQARPCLASEIRRDRACFFFFFFIIKLSKIHTLRITLKCTNKH